MNDVQQLRSALSGRVVGTGDDGYETLRQPWNLSIEQRPAFVVMAESVADVQAALRFATDHDLPLAVQSSGHGAVHPCDGGLVLNVSGLDHVRIDAETQRAHVGAGQRWRGVLEAADPHGLIGLSGTAPGVGVAGFTLGGGLGLTLRTFGFGADSLVGADVVTAEGELVRADDDEHPDLLWALKGGGGNFGVVTSLDLRLYPVPRVVNGMMAYPGARAAEIISGWAAWTRQVPDEVTSTVMLVTVPSLPAVPEHMRGQHLVMVQATVVGTDTAALDQLRAQLGAPIIDTFAPSAYLHAALSGMEPEDPSPAAGRSTLLTGLSEHTLAHIVAAAGPSSPITALEIRHLGGASAQMPQRPSAISPREASYILAMHAAPQDSAQAGSTIDHMDAVLAGVRDDAQAGMFLNFLPHGSTVDQVRRAYDDATYTRLTEVKRAYDPANLFRFNHNIPPAL